MKFRTPGHFKTAEAFREHLRTIAPDFDCDLRLEGADGPFGAPLTLFGRELSNRFAIHPMEGWDGTRDGLPTEPTLRRWRHFGASGAALIWGGEAVSVLESGRANANQLCFHRTADTAGGLARLLAELEGARTERGEAREHCLVGLQLTHSGRFARPDGEPAPRIPVHHPALDARFELPPSTEPLTDGELEEIGEAFVRAAVCARELGFDFVDVKCCHGYLLHELLGARTRPGTYGGDFAGRTRLLTRILDDIQRDAPGLGIGVRLSIVDTWPHRAAEGTRIGEPMEYASELPLRNGFGLDLDDPLRFDLTEPLALLELLRERGVRFVNSSAGSPYYCPHLQRPAAYPPSDGYLPPEDPLKSVFEQIEVVRAAKRAQPEMIFVGSGYSYLQEWLPHVAQHELRAGYVDFVGLGRMTLSYPEMPADLLAGRELRRRAICRTFSDCTTAPRNGLPSGCYPLDPYYKRSPQADELARIKARARSDS